MSNAYKKYVDNKSNAAVRVGVTTAICKGDLSGDELKQLISELETAGKLNNASIERIPSDKWNEEYLKLLRNETVGGTFSREYLEYLSVVSEYVKKKKSEKSIGKFIAVAVAVVVVILAVSAVISLVTKEKHSGVQQIDDKESRNGSIVTITERDEQVNDRETK